MDELSVQHALDYAHSPAMNELLRVSSIFLEIHLSLLWKGWPGSYGGHSAAQEHEQVHFSQHRTANF